MLRSMRPQQLAMIRRRRAWRGGVVADVTAPVLSLPLGLPLGDTSGYLGVTTDEGSGTLYYVVTTSATPPSATQVKAGQDHAGVAAAFAGSQAVGSTGARSATATGLSSNTAYYAYFMHEDAAANQSSVSAAAAFTTLTTGTSDTSFDNLIAAASVAPSDLRKGYIARRIYRYYVAGIWAKHDLDYVLAAHDEQFGRLNWVNPSAFTLSAINSPTFTTDRGFAGNGSSSYLDTTWDASTNGVQYTRDNCHLSCYVINQAGSNVAQFGIRTSFNASVVGAVGTTGRGRANAGSDLAATAGGAVPLQIMVRRVVSTDQTVLRDGVQVATGAQASAALSTTDFAFGLVGSNYSSRQIAMGSAGAHLDDTEAAAKYFADNEYLVALGADT